MAGFPIFANFSLDPAVKKTGLIDFPKKQALTKVKH